MGEKHQGSELCRDLQVVGVAGMMSINFLACKTGTIKISRPYYSLQEDTGLTHRGEKAFKFRESPCTQELQGLCREHSVQDEAPSGGSGRPVPQSAGQCLGQGVLNLSFLGLRRSREIQRVRGSRARFSWD